MKEIKKEVTIFVSDSGKEFENEGQCIKYEKKLKLEEKRRDFLTMIINGIFVENGIKGLKLYVQGLGGDCKIEVIREKGNYQVDECLDSFIKNDVWDKICEDVLLKYGFHVSVPYWYWSK